jgi:hypothetical protein
MKVADLLQYRREHSVIEYQISVYKGMDYMRMKGNTFKSRPAAFVQDILGRNRQVFSGSTQDEVGSIARAQESTTITL